jgi:hypothetical protein
LSNLLCDRLLDIKWQVNFEISHWELKNYFPGTIWNQIKPF